MTEETITVAEVGDLLKQVAARDQRTTGTADVVAWWNDLNTAHVSYRDAQAAANHYYAVVWPAQKPQERFRLTAPMVIELVRSTRRERLANFVYEPDPDESGAEFVENYDRQRDAVASGRTPPALSITRALNPRPVAELVSGVAAARTLPPEVADVIARRRPPGTSIRCPVCGAAPHRKCQAGTGRELSSLHATRIEEWAVALAACPTCRAPIGEYCTAYGKRRTEGAHPERLKAAGEAP